MLVLVLVLVLGEAVLVIEGTVKYRINRFGGRLRAPSQATEHEPDLQTEPPYSGIPLILAIPRDSEQVPPGWAGPAYSRVVDATVNPNVNQLIIINP